MQTMHNPPRPGEFITEVYIKNAQVSPKALASALGITESKTNALLAGEISIDAELALRLSKALGRSAHSWLSLQNNHDLFLLQDRADLSSIERLWEGEFSSED